MSSKAAAIALAAVLAAPVFAQTTAAPSWTTPVPPAITHYVPPGGSVSILLGPTPAAIAAANNTAVLGGPGTGPVLETVRIDVTNGWAIPPEAGRRADFQRWLRLP